MDVEKLNDSIISLRYGFESKGTYFHASKHCNIVAITYNAKTNQYIILDSRGITSWFKNSSLNYCTRSLTFDSYKFNLLRDIIYCRSANVYFGVSKEYGIKVFSLNFIEIFSIERDGSTILKLMFDSKRDELVIVCRNNFQFWKFTIVAKSRACDGLKLLRQFSVPNSLLINNAEHDSASERLYLVCDHDIWCYDVFGRCVQHYVHDRHLLSTLSVCAVSNSTNVVVSGSTTGEVSVYNMNGGLYATLLCHTEIVTSIIVHPLDGNLVISASMDGTIKVISLQTHEEIYNINVFPDGVPWLKLRSNQLIYCASEKCLRLFDLNYICSFWETIRCRVKSIHQYVNGQCNNGHILVHSEDKCIRLFNRKNAHKRCTILPPPEVTNKVLSFSYDKTGSVLYILFEPMLWIYITRTDPATRVAVWNIQDIIKEHMSTIDEFEDQCNTDQDSLFGIGKVSKNREKGSVKCLCISTLPRILHNDKLKSTLLNQFDLLMCGMDNGTVYLLDPSAPVSVVFGYKAHPTSPIIEMRTMTNKDGRTFILTLIKTINNLYLKLWNERTLQELDSIVIRESLSVYSVKDSYFVSGDRVGNIDVVKFKFLREHLTCNFSNEKTKNTEHNGRIVSVDVIEKKQLICSCGEDQYVRLWDLNKNILAEIKFDPSLSCCSFLGGSGSLLIGFKSNLFLITNKLLNIPQIDDYEDRASDSSNGNSDIYEDPEIKRESKRPTDFKVECLENYLIPYPYLGLDSIWLCEKPLDQIRDRDEDGEFSSRASTVSSCEYAATDIYSESCSSRISDIDLNSVELPRCFDSPEPVHLDSDAESEDQFYPEQSDVETEYENFASDASSLADIENDTEYIQNSRRGSDISAMSAMYQTEQNKQSKNKNKKRIGLKNKVKKLKKKSKTKSVNENQSQTKTKITPSFSNEMQKIGQSDFNLTTSDQVNIFSNTLLSTQNSNCKESGPIILENESSFHNEHLGESQGLDTLQTNDRKLAITTDQPSEQFSKQGYQKTISLSKNEIAQLAVNYFQSSSTTLSASAYKSILLQTTKEDDLKEKTRNNMKNVALKQSKNQSTLGDLIEDEDYQVVEMMLPGFRYNTQSKSRSKSCSNLRLDKKKIYPVNEVPLNPLELISRLYAESSHQTQNGRFQRVYNEHDAGILLNKKLRKLSRRFCMGNIPTDNKNMDFNEDSSENKLDTSNGLFRSKQTPMFFRSNSNCSSSQRKYSTTSNKTVSSLLGENDMGLNFVFQGNNCPLVSKQGDIQSLRKRSIIPLEKFSLNLNMISSENKKVIDVENIYHNKTSPNRTRTSSIIDVFIRHKSKEDTTATNLNSSAKIDFPDTNKMLKYSALTQQNSTRNEDTDEENVHINICSNKCSCHDNRQLHLQTISRENNRIKLDNKYSQFLSKKTDKSCPDKKNPLLKSELYCYNEPTQLCHTSKPDLKFGKEKRKEMMEKLEHKLSSQPYRFSLKKTKDDVINDRVKLDLLKSNNLGEKFLPRSKRSVSIPTKR